MLNHRNLIGKGYAVGTTVLFIAAQGYGFTQPPLNNSQMDVVPGTKLRVVPPVLTDVSRSTILLKVQNWIDAFNKLSRGTAGDFPYDTKKVEVFLTLNTKDERMWYIRCKEWRFSLDANTGRLITFENLMRPPLSSRQTRPGSAIPAIGGDSAAKVILRRYASLIPLNPGEKLVSPIFARDGDSRYTDANRMGRVFADIAMLAPGGYSFHQGFNPFGRIEVDPVDSALLYYGRISPVQFMTTRVVISAEEAIKRTRALRSIPQEITQKPKLFYVVSDPYRFVNDRYTNTGKGRFDEWPTKVYLAWVVVIKGKESASEIQVLIDAQTGEQLGVLVYG